MTKTVTTCDLCGKKVPKDSYRFKGCFCKPGYTEMTNALLNDVYSFDICLDCLSRGILKCQDGICYSDTGEWTNVHKNPDTEQTS